MDYLETNYNSDEKPLTNYPNKFTFYNLNRFSLKGKKMLEIGSGRGDFSNNFHKLGVKIYSIDINIRSKEYLNSEIYFNKCDIENEKLPFEKEFFDVIYSKSVLEHLVKSDNFFKEAKRVLKKNGLLITYTPDWETQFKNFYDDETHVKPYTLISLKQAHLKHGFNFLSGEKFYQLPITWKYPIIKQFCKLLSLITPIRSKNKFLRFSKELMILTVGKK